MIPVLYPSFRSLASLPPYLLPLSTTSSPSCHPDVFHFHLPPFPRHYILAIHSHSHSEHNQAILKKINLHFAFHTWGFLLHTLLSLTFYLHASLALLLHCFITYTYTFSLSLLFVVGSFHYSVLITIPNLSFGYPSNSLHVTRSIICCITWVIKTGASDALRIGLRFYRRQR
ncbi:hypothetical protein CPB84DRAFT_1368356 [Gymnopilus junonius]|uniref:Uncharacterized protein n=1 Tax=Gymnopilus junonius TaxID=109634 RepID=A0A9P5NHG5_GYMJU|nr:hypothetical protein CPB84DRAFT_1368356 [Gymnopilus junonius]